MRQDLDVLRAEIEDALRDSPFVIFHGECRLRESSPTAYWDAEEYPDFRLFLQAARKLDVGLVTFHHRRFSTAQAEEALDRLEDSELPREEFRDLEARLKELTRYGGFTCALELSFDFSGRTYLFVVNANWFNEYLNIMQELDDVMEMFGDEEPPVGGYFSNN
jgi:hypothetical protein